MNCQTFSQNPWTQGKHHHHHQHHGVTPILRIQPQIYRDFSDHLASKGDENRKKNHRGAEALLYDEVDLTAR